MKKTWHVLIIGSLFFLTCTGCFFPRFNVTVKPNDTGEFRQTLGVKCLADGIQEYYEAYGHLPARLADVEGFYDSRKFGAPRPRWTELTKDVWGTPYQYERTSATTYRLTSWGEDSKPGGIGDAKDVIQEIAVYRR